MKETQNKYYSKEDTISHFRFLSSYLNGFQVMQKITEFVESNCQLEEGETEEDLVKDLINRVYNYS